MITEDPVKLGLVASLARPGSNTTGLNFFTTEVNAKRLGLLRELVPAAARVAMLINPINAPNKSVTVKTVQPAARALGLQIQIFNASTSLEIDAAFTDLVPTRPKPCSSPRRLLHQPTGPIAALAARHACPRPMRCVNTLRPVG